MNFAKITLATAALAFSSLAAPMARRPVGRRRHLPLSGLCQVGGRLQERDRRRPQLPVDRLGRRHQADQGQDRDLRRLRRAAARQGARRIGPGPVPDGHGRHRAGREPRGRQAGRAGARRPDARQDLPRRDQEVGRPGHRQAQPQRQAAGAGDRHRPSLGRIGHDLQLQPTTCPRSSPDWKSKVGTNTAVQWPAGIGAKGNEGVANNVAQTKGSIGYVEYAYAKQNKLTFTKHGEQGGQDRRADHRTPSRPPPPTPTGTRSPATA